LKQTAAILFLTLFLFNLIGYKYCFIYLQAKEKSAFEASLDREDYNEKDLITFKIPLSIPYQNSQGDFERVDGEITINGTIYKYVKRKVEDGELILQCLPYYKKMSLVKASVEFSNHTNDPLSAGKKGATSSGGKASFSEEYELNARWNMGYPAGSPVRQHNLFLHSHPLHTFIALPGKPPELV
jgi:hypothetical protein